MSPFTISNRSKKKYLVPNPECARLRREQDGFKVMYGVLTEGKLKKKEHQVVLDTIKKALPDFEPGADVEAINAGYAKQIEAAEKEFADAGIVFYYRYPSTPEVRALFKQFSTNGVINAALFSGSPMDSGAVYDFSYAAAAEFLVGWEGFEEEDSNKPQVFSRDAVGFLPQQIVLDFAETVVFPYATKLFSRTKKAGDDPVPN